MQKCGIEAWVDQLNALYPSEVADRITRSVGCAPSFGFFALGVIEVILAKLEERSREES